MISSSYVNIRAIAEAGIVQITTFAGASFYSLGPGLGKRSGRGISGGTAGSRKVVLAGVRLGCAAAGDLALALSRQLVAVRSCDEDRHNESAPGESWRRSNCRGPLNSCAMAVREGVGRNLPAPIGHVMLNV